jgi:hypothetical protein
LELAGSGKGGGHRDERDRHEHMAAAHEQERDRHQGGQRAAREAHVDADHAERHREQVQAEAAALQDGAGDRQRQHEDEEAPEAVRVDEAAARAADHLAGARDEADVRRAPADVLVERERAGAARRDGRRAEHPVHVLPAADGHRDGHKHEQTGHQQSQHERCSREVGGVGGRRHGGAEQGGGGECERPGGRRERRPGATDQSDSGDHSGDQDDPDPGVYGAEAEVREQRHQQRRRDPDLGPRRRDEQQRGEHQRTRKDGGAHHPRRDGE